MSDDVPGSLESVRRRRPGAREAEAALRAAASFEPRDAATLARFHDALLFLRAYPHSPRVLSLADEALSRTGAHVARLADASGDLADLDSPEVAGLAVDYLTYTKREPLYYTPEHDVSASLFGRGGLPVSSWLSFEAEASLGPGYASELALSGFGLSYAVSGGPLIAWRGLRVALFGSRMQSQRASTYTSHSFGASAAMEF